jgi:hypothetical protein
VAENGKSYIIDALSFIPNRVNVRPGGEPPEWQTLPALIVSPCRSLETNPVRDALHAIAEEVKRIRGHYRFFAYSDATIALNPGFLGPPQLEQKMPDPRTHAARKST